MIRHYVSRGLQLFGLILTGSGLLTHFGDADARPLFRIAAVGAGVFCVGWLIRPQKG
jgi:hypothetical protein